MNRQFPIAALILIAAHTVSTADEYVIQPGPEGKDTYYGTVYVQNGDPDAASLYDGGWGDWYYDFFEFDLSGSPPASQTVRAEFHVYANVTPNDPALQIRRITESWTEDGVTLFNNPASVFAQDFGPLVAGWNVVDITDLYVGWKNGSFPNFGFKLSPTQNDHTNGNLASSDNTDSTIRPKLVITTNVQPIWTLRSDSGPSPRYTQAMAFDSARSVTVLFGGNTAPVGVMSGETWEWNGGTWSLRSTAGPSPNDAAAMAYDSARGVAVLFGGSPNTGGLSGETWEWNGTAWSLRSSTGPAPRRSQAMAYDAARGVTVLFGGVFNSSPFYSGETWEWNGSVWMLRSSSGPPARGEHAMSYDAGRGVTVLFGGYNGNQFGDTWEWDGITWTLRSDSGPFPRYRHAMAYDAARAETLLTGGWANNGYNNEVWKWNGSTWTPTSAGPSSRGLHAMAYDSARHTTVLFGGLTYGPGGLVHSGETWEHGDPAIYVPTLNSATPQCDDITPGILLSWTAVPGATNYDIFRNNIPIFTTQTAGTTFWNITGLSAGAPYTYRIRARFGSQTSELSNPASAVAPTCSTPPPPDHQPPPGQNIPPVTVTLNHLWQWSDAQQHFVHPLNNTVTIDPTAPTYVVAHGWDGTLDVNDSVCLLFPSYSMKSIGCAIRSAFSHLNQSVNLLAWDWHETANPNGDCDIPDQLTLALFEQLIDPNLTAAAVAASRVLYDARRSGLNSADEGNKLGKALAIQLSQSNGTLGTELHFIGYSHGGGVVGRAADVMNQMGHPADSITTLDTPKIGCVNYDLGPVHIHGCLVNSLQFVKPGTVKPTGQIAVFHYQNAVFGFGAPIAGGVQSNLTNIALNTDLVPLPPPLSNIVHLWICGPNSSMCPADTGWFDVGVWDPATSGPRTVYLNGVPFDSPLSVLGFPDGCYTEGTQFSFNGGTCPLGADQLESETPGLVQLDQDTFDDASSWLGTNAALVIGADPLDASNRTILISEQGDASFFKDIAWPGKALEITFDHMFREPRGEESLTVYLGDQIIYYDSADTSLAVGQLRSSGAISIVQAAGTTARLTLVLRTDGTPGGSIVLDNLRTWGILPGDMNGDTKLDGLDIQPFVNALLTNPTDPVNLYIADFDASGAVDAADIPIFVTALLNSGP